MKFMRQAHPRTRTRQRTIAVSLSLAIGAMVPFAVGSIADGGSPPVSAKTDRAPSSASPGSLEGADHLDVAATAAAGPAVHFHLADRESDQRVVPRRPAIAVPDPVPLVLARAPAGSLTVVLGDSYTSGWNGAGLGGHNWATLVGESRGWTVVNLAVAGTGFKNPGWTNQPVRSLLPRTIKLRPDVVIVASGHNDSRWSAAATSREAERNIDRIRADLPDAVIVIVAPIWQNGSAPARCLFLRDRLRAKAAAIGAVFIDPLAGRWFAGANHRFIGSDGLHPTNAGHRHIAELVLAALAETVGS